MGQHTPGIGNTGVESADRRRVGVHLARSLGYAHALAHEMGEGAGQREQSAASGKGQTDPPPPAFVERVQRYLMEDKRVEAGLELVEVATVLELHDLQGRAIGALARTRRIEKEVLDGTITRDGAEVERNAVVRQLHGLLAEAAESARHAVPRPSRPPAHEGENLAANPRRDTRAMVECRDVVKRYGPGFKLGPVSFSLPHGEILGVIGANGTGKTSLLRIVAGELATDEGECHVSPRDAGERMLPVPVMFVPESPPEWTGRMEQHLSWQAALFGYRTPRENALRVHEVLGMLDIMEYREKPWAHLSDGIRMRTAIAVAMLANPGLVVLDEPLGPLDPRSQQDLLRWLRVTAAGERRTSFVIAAHHVTEIEAITDQMLSLTPGAACSTVRPDATAAAGRHFRIALLPGADRSALRARLARLGDRVTFTEMPSYVLVQAAPGVEIGLTTLMAHVEGSQVISVEDLSCSSLRLLLWGERA